MEQDATVKDRNDNEKLVLGIPPSNNHFLRHYCLRSITRGPYRDIHPVRASLTPRATEYKQEAEAIATEQGLRLLRGRVQVLVEVYPRHRNPDPNNRSDLDNIPKVVFDSLNGIAWLDDSQIDRYTVERMPFDGRPRIELTITEIAPAREAGKPHPPAAHTGRGKERSAKPGGNGKSKEVYYDDPVQTSMHDARTGASKAAGKVGGVRPGAAESGSDGDRGEDEPRRQHGADSAYPRGSGPAIGAKTYANYRRRDGAD